MRRSWQQEPQLAHASSYLSLVLGLGHRLGLMSNEAQIREEQRLEREIDRFIEESLHCQEQQERSRRRRIAVTKLAAIVMAILAMVSILVARQGTHW